MASDPVIDIDQLCAPISDGLPAGPYWRDDDACMELFPRVQTAHTDSRYNHRKQSEAALFPEDSTERARYKDPEWRAVLKAATEFLALSKDLWVAAWLTEALAHVHGFAGLRDGFKLTRELCERYWDIIHPRPDDLDGIRNTIAKLDGDIVTSLVPLMPFTSNGLTTADYDNSAEMDGLDSEADKKSYRDRGVISTTDFEAHVRDSGLEFLQDVLDDARASHVEFVALHQLLDERCGDDAPPSSYAEESYQQTLELIKELAQPYLPTTDAAEGDDEADAELASGNVDVVGSDRPSGWDREQAFREISRLASLFKKHEPTSPVAWMLDRAVQLGNLAWPDLIDALAEDAAAARQILRQSGVANEENPEGD